MPNSTPAPRARLSRVRQSPRVEQSAAVRRITDMAKILHRTDPECALYSRALLKACKIVANDDAPGRSDRFMAEEREAARRQDRGHALVRLTHRLQSEAFDAGHPITFAEAMIAANKQLGGEF